jgi:virginiamycin A acetyltransferase
MNIRQIVKRSIKFLFLLIVLPFYGLYRLLSLISDKDGTFQSFSQAISLIPGKTGVYIRAAFYRLACPDTSDEILVGFLTVFSHCDTSIKRGVYIGPQCNIGKCSIGESTLLGSGVHILSGKKQHNFSGLDTPIQEQGGTYTKTVIGKDCWLGNGAIVMADIADQCIIAAGSVITQDVVTTATIHGGNPAKFLKNRPR